jgi:uncharacterized membrane protein YbjE (DUF340 family)
VPAFHEIETRRRLCDAATLGYLQTMSGFFPAMFEEMGARRRRLRDAFGDRGQGIVEFLVLAGLFIGSIGLFVRDWMPAAAPWGLAVPLVFVVGYVLIEARRQQAARTDGVDPALITRRYDMYVALWCLACALLGAAAFAIAWSAQPAHTGPAPDWTPPSNTVPTEIGP